MNVLPYGDRALLVEVEGLDEVLAVYAHLRTCTEAGIEALVPAARTLLVRFDPAATSRSRLLDLVGAAPLGSRPEPEGDEVVVPVVYDGADLEEVGALTGLGVDGVVAAHTGQRWTVGFVGFAPGFGYLVGEDDRLEVPRRSTPRPEVPAGAVGLAGRYSGVYPRRSPGGWQLLGTTRLAVWDLRRDPPALLRPGTAVRFVDAT